MLTLLPILLCSALLALLGIEAIYLYRYTERNILQKTLLRVILLWFILFLLAEINMLQVYEGTKSPTVGVLNFQGLAFGFIGFFPLTIYAGLVIHPNLVNKRTTLISISPVIILMLVYIYWHLVNNVPLNHKYLTIKEFKENIYTIPVILRISMATYFFTYLIIMLYNIWKLIPIYNQYSAENYSDAAYNVSWLRIFIRSFIFIGSGYILILLFKHPLAEIYYILSIIIVFGLLTEKTLFHRPFARPEELQVEWSIKSGWKRVMPEASPVLQDEKISHQYEELFENWIKNTKPYLNPEFKAKDVYEVIPELDNQVMTTLLQHRDHTFQTYVRECRITEACNIMINDPDIQIKDIALKVGFNFAPSFTRAFIAVKGMTPKGYRSILQPNNTEISN